MRNTAINLKRSRPTCVVLLLLVSLLSAGPALARNLETTGANERSALPQQQGQGPTDPAELEAFMEGFNVASVSKLFAWTAVMQLVEQGLLDLDAVRAVRPARDPGSPSSVIPKTGGAK